MTEYMIVRWRDKNGKTHNDKVKRSNMDKKFKEIEEARGRLTGVEQVRE